MRKKPNKKTSKLEIVKPEFDETELRDEVTRMLTFSYGDNEIIGTLKYKIGAPISKTKAMIAEIRRLWKDEELDLETKREHAIRRMKSHIEKAVKAGNYGSVAQLEKQLAELEGTKRPEQIEISVNTRIREAVEFTLDELSPEEIRALAISNKHRLE